MNNKLAILLSLIVFTVFSLSICACFARATNYIFDGYTSSFDGTEYGLTFNFTDGDCRLSMSSTNTFVATSCDYDAGITWECPDGVILGKSTLTDVCNTSCLTYGETGFNEIDRELSSTFYEPRWIQTNGADSGFVTTRTRYDCEFEGIYANFSINHNPDSRGHCLYRIRTQKGIHRSEWLDNIEGNYTICGNLYRYDVGSCTIVQTTQQDDWTFQYIYPFNSSIGVVNYNFTASSAVLVTSALPMHYYIDLIDITDGVQTNLYTQNNGASLTHSFNAHGGSLSLDENKQYVFALTYWIEANPSDAHDHTIYPSNLTVSIYAYTGNYECGAWSTCINSSQWRLCEDQAGIGFDQVETRGCLSVPSWQSILGFEEFFEQEVYVCTKNYTYGCVGNSLETIDAKYPINWSVSGDLDTSSIVRQNFVSISQDTYTHGVKSLKMWYIPPKMEEPVNDGAGGTTCGNKTVGDFPEVSTGFNETMFLETNVSFPASYIDMRFNVKKCTIPVTQYDYTGDFFGFNCGEICYAQSCNQTPLGNFGVRLTDLSNSEIVFDLTDEATDDWQFYVTDLTNVGLQAEHNYTLALAVNPNNVFDPLTHCVYFDYFRVATRETALEVCEDYCEGFDYYNGELLGDACIYKVQTNSPYCVPQNVSDDVIQILDGNGTALCIGNDRHIFDRDHGDWEVIEDSPECIEAEEQESLQLTLYDPPEYLATILNSYGWTPTGGLEFIWFMISTFMLINYIALGVGIGVTRLLKDIDNKNNKEIHVDFKIFGAVTLIIIMSFFFAGFYPIEAGLTVIVILALFLYHEFGDKLTGKGG